MAMEADIFTQLHKHTTKPRHEVPLLVLCPPNSSSNQIYPVIEYINTAGFLNHRHDYKRSEYNKINFNNYTFHSHTFSLNKTSKSAVVDWIYQCILNPHFRKFISFKSSSITSIINSANKNSISLVRASINPLIETKSNKTVWFLVTLKDRFKRKGDKYTHAGLKIDVQMLMPDPKYQQLDFGSKLHIHNWGMQFAKHISTMKWEYISDTSPGYYYRVHHVKQEPLQISVDNVRFTKTGKSLRHNALCERYSPGIYYNADLKNIKHIDSFIRRTNSAYPYGFIPIADSVTRNVISDMMAADLYAAYNEWIHSGNGVHQFAPNARNYHRVKSFIFFNYWWNSTENKAKKARFENNKRDWTLANDNVACGLRYIGEDCPEFVIRLIKYLKSIGVIPEDIHYTQIAINLYKANHSGKKQQFSVSFLESHSECDKFSVLHQLTIGSDCVLSYDTQRSVNGSAGIELERNAFIKYNMKSYWMGASNVLNDKGGKHQVLKRNLLMTHSKWRMTFLFRVCQDDPRKAAMRHNDVCKNDDEWCYCLNPKLKSLNRN